MIGFSWGKIDVTLAVGVLKDGELKSMLKFGGNCLVWSVWGFILKHYGLKQLGIYTSSGYSNSPHQDWGKDSYVYVLAIWIAYIVMCVCWLFR